MTDDERSALRAPDPLVFWVGLGATVLLGLLVGVYVF